MADVVMKTVLTQTKVTKVSIVLEAEDLAALLMKTAQKHLDDEGFDGKFSMEIVWDSDNDCVYRAVVKCVKDESYPPVEDQKVINV